MAQINKWEEGKGTGNISVTGRDRGEGYENEREVLEAEGC